MKNFQILSISFTYLSPIEQVLISDYFDDDDVNGLILLTHADNLMF